MAPMPKRIRIRTRIEDPPSFADRERLTRSLVGYEHSPDPRIAEARGKRPFRDSKALGGCPDPVLIDLNCFDRREIEIPKDRIARSDDRQDIGDFEIDEG